jgi:hypothetical protein
MFFAIFRSTEGSTAFWLSWSLLMESRPPKFARLRPGTLPLLWTGIVAESHAAKKSGWLCLSPCAPYSGSFKKAEIVIPSKQPSMAAKQRQATYGSDFLSFFFLCAAAAAAMASRSDPSASRLAAAVCCSAVPRRRPNSRLPTARLRRVLRRWGGWGGNAPSDHGLARLVGRGCSKGARRGVRTLLAGAQSLRRRSPIAARRQGRRDGKLGPPARRR